MSVTLSHHGGAPGKKHHYEYQLCHRGPWTWPLLFREPYAICKFLPDSSKPPCEIGKESFVICV